MEAPPAANELFYLQAGAFQKADDADNQKARLSMLGLDVTVQEATVADKGKMFRVRVGPFAKPEEMNRVRNQLAQNGIQATVVKIKQAPKN
jgi:cell division protein FtsN